MSAAAGVAVLSSAAALVPAPAEAKPAAIGKSASVAITAPVKLLRSSITVPLRVASYNVRCASCYQGGKNEKRWSARRALIVATIREQDLAVIGVQEVSQGRLPGKGDVSQFGDLLNHLGGTWRLTNAKRYNCARSISPNHCRKVYQGASGAIRIFYDSAEVSLVAAGSTKLPSPKAEGDNYMAWAQFTQRRNGARFMFSNLHTASPDKYASYKRRQAVAAAASLEAHNPGGLPMIAVGDWNSSRFEKGGNGPYNAYRAAGFHDPLGGSYRTSHSAPGATVENRIRTWLSSSNRWSRKAPAHRSWINGSYIDYIMTTPMRVSEWETVARLDASGRFVGTIPSDHNMIRATVWLPRG